MVTYATVASGIEGYNPPDYYRTLEVHSDIDRFLSDIRAGAIISETECKNDVFNGMGKCTVNYLDKRQIYSESVILIRDAGYYIVGKIDSWEFIAEGIIEFKYTIDWYTSVILMSDFNANAFPVGKTVLYRRLMEGEFDYIDDGFKPTMITINKKHSSFVGTTQYALVIYNDAPHNQTWWILAPIKYSIAEGSAIEATENPKHMWEQYLAQEGITVNTGTFNPNNVLFFGYINLPLDAIPTFGSRTYRTLNWHYYIEEPNDLANYVCTGYAQKNVTLNVGASGTTYTSKAYRKYQILDKDGYVILELPAGVGVSSLSAKAVIDTNTSAPAITFIHTSNFIWQSPSFTIGFKPLLYLVDNQQVYNAEERVYAQANRSLQATNELVSGVLGSANQGAMISAFSRTGARTGKQAMDKGVIGGLVGAVSSLGQYAYTTLYADKEAQRIEDAYQKLKPDVLLMNGGIDYESSMAGLYEFSYDSITIDNILAYQSAFGYMTNKIESNVELNHYTGYVQADVMFDRRKYHANNTDYYYGYSGVVEKYIKDMFNYGVYFTKVVTNE